MNLKIEDLLQHKALQPLPTNIIAELEKLQSLDVSSYTEAEVRAYVIDPIVKILGFEKGTTFSPDLEKSIKFLDSRKQIDYKCTLWEENFWIVEAKKPKQKARRKFEYSVFKQALEYAVHPQINAALIVLCDGDLFEVFDREEKVVEPLLRFKRVDLVKNIDSVRALLSPWQVWFFEKRRITRLIDKVFDREFNLQRLSEFQNVVYGRLESKRATVLKNYQRTFDAKQDQQQQRDFLRAMSTDDIIDAWFFLTLPSPDIHTMVEALVERCLSNPFPILYKLFPDEPRDACDTYYAYALRFLATLHDRTRDGGFVLNWLPSWLKSPNSNDANIETAIHILLEHCLTQFHDDEPRKITLLLYAAVRRILKRSALMKESEWTAAEQQFAFMRFVSEEVSWGQFASSPAGFVLQSINSRSISVTARLIALLKNDRRTLQVATAKAKLSDLWALEALFIKRSPNYANLREEKGISETYLSEDIDVTTDYLGHMSVCMLESFPEWKQYALQHHPNEIAMLAALGSWKAREWLGPDVPPIGISEQDLAERFFFGETGALRSLTESAG